MRATSSALRSTPARRVFYGSPKPTGGYAESIDHILVDAAHADGVRNFAVLTDDAACNTSDHCPVMIEWETDRFPFPQKKEQK